MEVSLAPIYEGEALFPEMLDLMMSKGFQLMALNPGLTDYVSGQMLQADCIFFNKLA